MKRYLIVWLSLTGALLCAVALINLVVDPYGLSRSIDRPGFNSVKPDAGGQGRMVKAHQVLRVQPRGLILGNSRAEVGLDPQNPVWPQAAQPVFNLALPGTGTQVTVRYLRHVLHGAGPDHKPTMVVWGIDFMDFLVDSRLKPEPGSHAMDDPRLLARHDGSANPARPIQVMRDYITSTLTLAAFLDSVDTLRAQHDPYAADLTASGFNPMRDYLKIAATEGYRSLFRQRDLENIRSYLRRPNGITDADGRSSPALDDLRQVIRLCRENGIDLHLFIYPYHAHLLEIFRLTGQWPAFEAWKRAVLNIVDEDARMGGSVHLWDFSGVNSLTGERVPEPGDRRSQMRWYWEAGHFKRELGDLVLQRMFNSPDAGYPEFGVQLSQKNLPLVTENIRRQTAAYRIEHAADVRELAEMFTQFSKKGN